MDTQNALSIITGLKTTVDSSLVGFKAQSDALLVAEEIIKGTLATQALELENRYETIIADKDIIISDNEIVIAEKNVLIAQLQSIIDNSPVV